MSKPAEKAKARSDRGENLEYSTISQFIGKRRQNLVVKTITQVYENK
jgi:hypothetical protein